MSTLLWVIIGCLLFTRRSMKGLEWLTGKEDFEILLLEADILELTIGVTIDNSLVIVIVSETSWRM